MRAELYLREDKFRLHKERVEAYSAFYIKAGVARQVMTSGAERRGLNKARNALWTTYTRLALVGGNDVAGAASRVLKYVNGVAYHGETFESARYRELVVEFQRVARLDVVGAVEEA